MFPGNGVQQGLRYVFFFTFSLYGGCVKNVSPISSNMYINHAVFKRQLAQWVQVKSFTNVFTYYLYCAFLKPKALH